MTDLQRPPPSLPGLPADQPISTDPVDGVSLAEYARISAELAERTRPAKEVLGACGLTEARWLAVEQVWPIRIAGAALRGDTSLAEEYDREYLAAQDALGGTQPTRTLEQYAALVAHMEAGENPAVVTARDGLSLPDWARLSRYWNQRLAEEPAEAEEFRSLLTAARSSGAAG